MTGQNVGEGTSGGGGLAGGGRSAAWWQLFRPFTLLPPLLGMLSGALCALGARALRSGQSPLEVFGSNPQGYGFAVVMGALMAATLNAGSNALNQITDLENDRHNKPGRPLPSGRLSIREAFLGSALLYAVALAAAWHVRPPGVEARECFWIALGGGLASLIYSVPPIRTKRWGWPAQITIAASRGLLLRACGWACVATTFRDPEPWFSGAVFFLFLVGASATKDFADMKGDRAAGCFTLPVVHGPRGAARRIVPFLVLPWLFLPLGLLLPHPAGGALLAADPRWICWASVGLAVYGSYVAWRVLADPDELARVENHPSWVHMYGLMMAAQVGLASAYLL